MAMLEHNQRSYDDKQMEASSRLFEESYGFLASGVRVGDASSSSTLRESERLVFGESFDKKDIRRSDDNSDGGRPHGDQNEVKLSSAGSIFILLGEKSGLAVKELKAFAEKFEKKSKALGIDQTEVSETYANIAKILADKGGSPFSANERERIASKLMSVLTPSQQSSRTIRAVHECAPNRPAAYSAMIAEIALTGDCKKLHDWAVDVSDLNSKSIDYPFELIDVFFKRQQIHREYEKQLLKGPTPNRTSDFYK